MKLLRAGAVALEPAPSDAEGWTLPADTVWIDLHNPSREEEHQVERALGLLLPTREEMLEIEVSSRVYQDGDATFMTALVLYNTASEAPSAEPITFVLTKDRLVTIRYIEPKSCAAFVAQASRQSAL